MAKKAVKTKPATKSAKRVTIAVKPRRPTKPSLPLPPPPPPPPPVRAELEAPRDVARLLRYGERFGSKQIDIRMLPVHQQLSIASGRIALGDPNVAKTWKVLDRPVAAGSFRVMVSVSRDGDDEALAAVVIHVGRPPIVRWTVAHASGQRPPKSAEQIPRWPVTSRWFALVDPGDGALGVIAVPSAPLAGAAVDVPLTDGRRALALPCRNGEFAAYWAIGADDKPVCLVIDFDAFTQKEWKAKS